MYRSPTWRLALALVPVVLGACAPRGSASPCANQQLGELAGELRARRFVEARLTCFDEWVGCRPDGSPADLLPDARCGDWPRLPAEKLERVAEIGRDLRGIAEAGHDAASLQTRGTWHLLWWSRASSIDRSIAALQQASGDEPGSHQILSDLAAAYLTRAVAENRPFDLFRAFSRSTRATDLAPRHPAALFNHALILDRMFAESAARQAWTAYLEVDPDSDWSREARQRLSALDAIPASVLWQNQKERLASGDPAERGAAATESVERFAQHARQYVEEELLPAWAETFLAEGAAARAEELYLARELARLLYERSSDRLLLDSVELILQAAADERGTEARAGSIARALIDHRDGRALHDQQRYEPARPRLESASAGLDGIPLSLWAEFYVAVGRYHESDSERAYRALSGLEQTARHRGYAALGAYCNWMLGLIEGRRSRHGLALAHFDAARTAFGQLGEVENVAAVRALSAFVYFYLGDRETAWSHLYQALSSRPGIRSSRRLQNILAEAVDALERSAEPHAAIPYQTDLVRLALASGSPLSGALALRRRSRLLARLGRAEAAGGDLGEAWRLSESIPSPGLQGGIQAGLLIAEARLSRELSPASSVASLTAALDYNLDARDRHLLIQILRERAAALIDLGRAAEAAADLRRGVAELEEQWRDIDQGPLRPFFLDQARGLFESLVLIELSSSRGETAALGLVERMRALPGPSGGQPLAPVGEVCSALPRQGAAVTYLVTGSELLAWVHSTDCHQPKLVRSDISASALDRLASGFYAATAGRRVAEAEEAGRRLWQLLIEPLMPHLEGARSLVVVPDESLHWVPFAALRAADGRAFLVEEFALTVAPSLRSFVGHRRAYGRLAERPAQSILFIADPAIDRKLFPMLPPLPDSRAEGESIGRLYRRPTLLGGEEATPARVLSAIGGAEVFHFSGHALRPGRSGSEPGLLLATDGDELAVLSADHLPSRQLGKTRLAFLGACSTAGGRVSSVVGPASLARSFLERGVPAVIATLWDVEDRQAARLARSFHSAYLSGLTPAAALQAAQIEMLRDNGERSPSYWAAFQLHGGAT